MNNRIIDALNGLKIRSLTNDGALISKRDVLEILQVPGERGSYSAIAFETGRILGREEAAKILENLASTWIKPTAFNYRAELRRLAAEIRKSKDESRDS